MGFDVGAMGLCFSFLRPVRKQQKTGLPHTRAIKSARGGLAIASPWPHGLHGVAMAHVHNFLTSLRTSSTRIDAQLVQSSTCQTGLALWRSNRFGAELVRVLCARAA